MAALNPYLNFSGNTEEAFEFYKSVFGGEFSMVMRYKDVPSEIPSPKTDPDKIMHIALPIGTDSVLMGSDIPESYGKVNNGNNISISINTESEEEADKLYKGLTDGGKATMPMDKVFWGAYFGMCSDKYGIHWMVNHDLKK
ncbi:MAG: VOC family protein [Ignavibacteria bacterium]